MITALLSSGLTGYLTKSSQLSPYALRLRAQNTSLTTELEEIRADLDAFIVENEQLAELVCSMPRWRVWITL